MPRHKPSRGRFKRRAAALPRITAAKAKAEQEFRFYTASVSKKAKAMSDEDRAVLAEAAAKRIAKHTAAQEGTLVAMHREFD